METRYQYPTVKLPPEAPTETFEAAQQYFHSVEFEIRKILDQMQEAETKFGVRVLKPEVTFNLESRHIAIAFERNSIALEVMLADVVDNPDRHVLFAYYRDIAAPVLETVIGVGEGGEFVDGIPYLSSNLWVQRVGEWMLHHSKELKEGRSGWSISYTTFNFFKVS